MICKFHSANSFGIYFAALFSNKNMTLLNGFCSVQLLGVIDITVGFGGVAESNTAGGKQITVESVQSQHLFAAPSYFLYIFVKFKVNPCLMLKSIHFSLPRC